MSNAIKYDLKFPIKVTKYLSTGDREETLTSMELRRPIAKDMRRTDGVEGEVAKSIVLIAQLSGWGVPDVDQLDIADLAGIGEIIEGFTAPGPATGATS
ncbi:MAG: phage tail assembly protein [Sphingobium sp.]